MRGSLILGAVLLLGSGCGAGGEDGSAPAHGDQVYEANATVLEQGPGMAEAGHGPELCLGGMNDSYPPQCGGPPIANWDWSTIDGEEAASGTTWGEYHVVGSYDGKTFTVVEAGPPEMTTTPEDDREFDSRCEPPAGGWDVASWSDETDAATAYIEAQPDYVRSWITYVTQPVADEEDPGPYILNVIFTGDAERHEAEIRELWSGPLCVVAEDAPTERTVEQLVTDVADALETMGLAPLYVDYQDGVEAVVVLDLNGAAQAAFDERYGPGVVTVISALQPVGE